MQAMIAAFSPIPGSRSQVLKHPGPSGRGFFCKKYRQLPGTFLDRICPRVTQRQFIFSSFNRLFSTDCSVSILCRPHGRLFFVLRGLLVPDFLDIRVSQTFGRVRRPGEHAVQSDRPAPTPARPGEPLPSRRTARRCLSRHTNHPARRRECPAASGAVCVRWMTRRES